MVEANGVTSAKISDAPVRDTSDLTSDQHMRILSWLSGLIIKPTNRNNAGLQIRTQLEDTIGDLVQDYHELNANTIDEVYNEPSPLEFMRYVSQNRPFVIRKGAVAWDACRKWDADYLKEVMGNQLVQVAVTPHGNADSVMEMSDGDLLFLKPYETEEPFAEVMAKIQQQERQQEYKGNTRYAQTQNDNLRNEYQPLFSDVPKNIPFARIALQRSPDAINFWLGNSHSTTALHKDNYENIYVQVLGSKHFTLLPPICYPCIHEQVLPAATYAPRLIPTSTTPPSDAPITGSPLATEDLVVYVDSPPVSIPFATWDPDKPLERATDFSHLAKSIKVTLEEGDMLYLPALWYHKVSQSSSAQGLSCSVNYWYDLDFAAPLWSHAAFVRGVTRLSYGYRDGDGGAEQQQQQQNQ